MTKEELLEQGPAVLKPTPHPLLPWFNEEQLRGLLQAGKQAEVVQLYNQREERIRLATDDVAGDPYLHHFRLPHWKDADQMLAESDLLYVSGGKRASKSEWAAPAVVESAMTYGKGMLWCFQGNLDTSIAQQQKLIWKYLPKHIKALNQKRHPVYSINFTEINGFANGRLVLPNRTMIWFLTYGQKVEDFQGWKLGAPSYEPMKRPDGTIVPNIGAWADENMTLKWYETLLFRCGDHRAKIIWTFSPLEGITTTIKQVLSASRCVKSRPAPLLPKNRKLVEMPEVPPGHMPYVVKTAKEGVNAIYFHTDLNPFFGCYDVVKRNCESKPFDYVERNAYGYARDTMARAFPLFSSVNIIEAAHLPEHGTNYLFLDPAGARNYCMIWVRIAPGNPYDFYIYREWPDVQRYGEWAVPSANPDNPDGDVGPAQRSLGYGVIKYKQLILEAERIQVHAGAVKEIDPYRRRLQLAAIEANKEADEPAQTVQEDIRERYMDPRAGKNQHMAEKGGISLMDLFSEQNKDTATGLITGERMHFRPAPGLDLDEGIGQVNTLLEWEPEQDLVPMVNAPRLFVVKTCRQSIWMAENYTGRGGEKAGCKDFADLWRYMATARLRHITPGMMKTKGGGSY